MVGDMALNRMMHPRNPYKDKPPNFRALAEKYDDFRSHCSVGPDGKIYINFRDTDAVRALSRVLLHNDFGLTVELPPDCLVPRIPQKLNYVLWIDDLLKLNGITDNVTGIDIGTGASCVYALLGAKQCGWHFVATDADKFAFEVACRNVAHNNMTNQIEVIHVGESEMIVDVVQSHSDKSFTFCMCNPPFFQNDETEQKFVHLDDESMHNQLLTEGSRRAPHSATTARTNELSFEGGEVAFVGRIIEDSVILKNAIRVYTSMVGKKSSLPKLKEKLRRLCDARYMVSSLNQGKTQRWVLTWTFDPDIKLMSNHHECRPMEVRLPNSMPPRAAFFEWLKLTLANLEITMDPIGDEEYLCKSSKNTWSNQRNKRRAMILQSPSSSLQLPQPKKARYSHVDVSVTANLGVGDGKDSLSDAGNFNSCSDIAVSSQRSDAVIQAYHPVSSESHSLVTFRLCLKYSKSCLHLRWVDGSRHALHQITQYLRNHLSKNLLIA